MLEANCKSIAFIQRNKYPRQSVQIQRQGRAGINRAETEFQVIE